MPPDAPAIDAVASWLADLVVGLEDMAGDGGSRAAFDAALARGAALEVGLFAGSAVDRLSEAERRILLVAVAPELEPRTARLYALATDLYSYSRPTVALCLELAAASARERLAFRALLAPGARLIEDGWLRVRESSGKSWLESEVVAAHAAVQMLLGQSVTGTDRDALFRIWDPGPRLAEVVLPVDAHDQLTHFIDRCRDRREGSGSLVLLLSGPSGTGKTLTARATAAELGRPLMVVDPLGGMLRRDELEFRLEQLSRDARLIDGVLFFDECEGWFESRLEGDRTVLRLLELLDRQRQIAILATNLPDNLDPALDRRVSLRVEFKIPTRPQREAIWRLHLSGTPVAPDLDLSWLAERYELSGGHIANAAEAAIQEANRRRQPVAQADLEQAADLQVRHRLSRLAIETPTHLTLADLIITDEIRGKLEEIIAAVRNRRLLFEEWGFGRRLSTGRGLCMLFRGDPGTGKTLSAEVLASELKMPLYRASIPKLVSKYVGETERNLERAFREATAARGLLLFDEADAIFSKRVEVSTAQDRYANMEVNLLLQEIERFDGVVILTTNLRTAIDEAFERRLNFKVDFPFPEADDRALIWQLLLPAQAPVEVGIDFEHLGEAFELSGGSIKNAVLRAAYAAARQGSGISMDILEAAARTEYKELGKLVRDQGW